MAEIVWPQHVVDAYLRSPEALAVQRAFVEAFIAGTPLLVRIRDDAEGTVEAIPITDFYT